MMLGAYTFAWLPDKMTIPRPGKSVDVVKNLGGVAYLTGPPMVAGERIVMEWDFVSAAQYAALRSIYQAGAIVTWDLLTNGLRVPTGTAEVAYDVKVLSLDAKFFDVVDVDFPYVKDAKMILIVRE